MCDLDLPFLDQLWSRSSGRCAVSGVGFSDERFEHALVKHPYAPSLDQVVAGAGYTRANVRLVCVAVNFAMNEWGDGPLRRIVEGMLQVDPKGLVTRVEEVWAITMRVRIDEALRAASLMDGEALRQQRKRVAGLRASLTKGRMGLRAAAAAAVAARQSALLSGD